MIQLYMVLHRKEKDTQWSQNLTTDLEKFPGIERVMTIGQNNVDDLQLNLDFDFNLCDLKLIETVIMQTGGTIVTTDVHFPHEITGISDSYGASAVSLPLTEEIKKVQGVLGASVSSSGIIKIEIASGSNEKDAIIRKVFEIISGRRSKS